MLASSQSRFDGGLFLEFVAGIGLVIASAGVFNNFLDRKIDRKMTRTKGRALAAHKISPPTALSYGTALGVLGLAILWVGVNVLTAVLCGLALVLYVVVYGWAKRHTVYSTLIGSIPGAIPPLAGYCAVVNHLDKTGAALFLILAFWQIPHFYAISMYRWRDYKNAGLPVISVKQGLRAARVQTTFFIFGFALVSLLLSLWGPTGWVYLIGIIGLSGWWVWKAVFSYKGLADELWGKKMFLTSLVVNIGTAALISAGGLLP